MANPKWVKGCPPPNPTGRPKGSFNGHNIKAILDRILKDDLLNDPLIPEKIKQKFRKSEDMRSLSKLEAIMEMVTLFAMKGESWAVQFMADRTEGKVKDELVVHSPPPLDVTVHTQEEKAQLEKHLNDIGSMGI